MPLLPLRRPALSALAAGALLVTASPALPLSAPASPGPADWPDDGSVAAPESSSGLWIVHLDDPSTAAYSGGIDGLAATSRQATGADRLDPTSPRAQQYAGHLRAVQDEVGIDISATLGREVAIADSYQFALNAVVLELSAAEAAVVGELPGIAWVEPDQEWELETDVSNELIGSPAIWDGQTGPEVGTRGEGVIVAMLDTGVNPDHPSFAATDGDGYTHVNPYGAGTYVGVCDPESEAPQELCNDKLIGMYDYTGTGPVDDNDHGSHVGATMAGNSHDAVFTVGVDEYTLAVAGVAPRANVISYKVCSLLCNSVGSVAAVEQAILDDVDVLNYSISGPDNPWNNAVDLAFLSAFEAGIFVAASAGNDGPDEHSVAKTAPWNATVAATNSHRLIAHEVSVVAPEPVPEELTGLSGVPGSGPGITEPIEASVLSASSVDPENELGCAAFPGGAFDGSIALIERGECNFSVKVNNAAAAGASAVVVTNNFPGPAIVMGALETTSIPAVMATLEEGTPLHDFVAATAGTELLIDTTTVYSTTPEWALMVSDFSSRGPSTFDLMAPTFATPGRNILAAAAATPEQSDTYTFMQGTSMASPHAAGAGALLRALHPDWSPAQIRSALASTADPSGLLKEDGETSADPYDVGSGLVDLEAAGRIGVVLDETHANFVAADPATGGDPTTLNLPAFVNQNCLHSCSFTRTFTGVADAPAHYTVQIAQPPGVTIEVQPAEFTLEPGATQELTVTADVSELTGGDALFGSLELTTDAAHVGGAPVADVHYPIVLVKGEAAIDLEPAEVGWTLGVDETAEQEVSIGNTGGAELTWQLSTEGDCALPQWVDVSPQSGQVSPGETQELLVSVDSADAPGGVYSASACLTSNDPHTPVATLDITLEVVEIPVAELSTDTLELTIPSGNSDDGSVTLTNAGYGSLDWTLTDPDAGPGPDRIDLLRDGVLLVPNSGSSDRGVMAFDRHDGTLLDATFIPHHDYAETTLYTPNQVVANADGTGFLVADQIRHVITSYDLEGNFRGYFAPTPDGPDTEILQNIRGIAWSPDGTLLATVASGANANSIVEFDDQGNYLGHFIEPELDGMSGPWFVHFRDQDVLVSANGSESVHRFSTDGSTALDAFLTGVRWPEQIAETDTGTVLVANWSTSTAAPLPAGVHEFTADGEHLGHYSAEGNSYAGVHPLGNGNILTTTSAGVYEIDRSGEVVEQEQTGGRGRFITEIALPDLLPCSVPDDIGWLDADPAAGSLLRAEDEQITVSVDTTGLELGEHRVRLCVSGNDPNRPYLPLDVALTVTEPDPVECTRTITGTHLGPLTVLDGRTCLAPGSQVLGPVTVLNGALAGDDTRILGPVTAAHASGVEIDASMVIGPVTLHAGTEVVRLDGSQVLGPVDLRDNSTTEGAVIADNQIVGPLSCHDNAPPPHDDGRPNSILGPRTGQCADF